MESVTERLALWIWVEIESFRSDVTWNRKVRNGRDRHTYKACSTESDHWFSLGHYSLLHYSLPNYTDSTYPGRDLFLSFLKLSMTPGTFCMQKLHPQRVLISLINIYAISCCAPTFWMCLTGCQPGGNCRLCTTSYKLMNSLDDFR